jgi:2'-5' RNA ligase
MRQRVAPFCTLLNKELGWQVRLVNPKNWHLTALFFDDLDEVERAEVWAEVLRNVGAGAWSGLLFPWTGLALWPTPRRPNLICLEAPVYPEAAQWPLAERIAAPPFSKADTAHFAEYRPHITLMRFRGPTTRPYAKEWQAIQREIPLIPPTAIRFDSVSMILSDVKPDRPVYTREYTATL